MSYVKMDQREAPPKAECVLARSPSVEKLGVWGKFSFPPFRCENSLRMVALATIPSRNARCALAHELSR